MGDDRQIDRGQHRLPGPVRDRLASDEDLLVALGHDPEAQVVDAVQRLGRRRAAVKRQGRNRGVVIAIILGNSRDLGG